MAKDQEIEITLKITEKGGKLSVTAENTKKLAKETKEVDKQQKKAANSANKFHKGQKGVAQAGMNSTKAFSKMKGEMGGSSGLVGAYATLAANVFAATAAFNALRGAAQVQTLAEGFGFLAAASGRSSEVIAGNIQRITGNALSMEEALRTAAVGIQSGFSSTQLERLTEVAKNASIALGRNLGDSVDRLVRGVAKLEPEILDELGIIVRLNTATATYAQKIGKAVGDLSEFERTQAFLNATLEQGEMKYGALGDAVDVNPFDKLAGAFTNLSNKVLGFGTKVLGPFVGLFATSQLAMGGALIAFGSTIVTQMLPGLTSLSEKQLAVAKTAREMAEAETSAGEKIAKAQRKVVAGGGNVDSPAGFKQLQTRLKKGKASAKDMQMGLDSLKRSERARAKALEKYSGEELKNKKAELAEIRRLQTETQKLINVEANRGTSTNKGIRASGRADRADIMATGVSDIQGVGGLKGFSQARKANKLLRLSLKKTKLQIDANSRGIKAFGSKALVSFRTAAGGAKLFGVALLNAIPVIGQILMVVGALFAVFKKFYGSSEDVNTSLKNLTIVGDTFAKKQEVFNKVQERLNKAIEASSEELQGNKRAYAIAGLEAQKYANTVKFTAGVTGEFSDSAQRLQQSLASDGVGVFTIMMMRLKGLVSNVTTAIGELVKKLFSAIRGMLEWAASFGDGEGKADKLLKTFNEFEKGLQPANRQMEAFATTMQGSFDKITDPEIKKKLLSQLGQGGLAGAIESAKAAMANGISFEAATNGIVEALVSVGTEAKEVDNSITGFGSTFQELNKQLNKGAQTAKAQNEFGDLASKLTAFKNSSEKLISKNGIEEARKQLKNLVPPELNNQLTSLGFTFEDLLSFKGVDGPLAEFIKEMEAAATLKERLTSMKAENKTAVAADKKAVEVAEKRLNIEAQILALRFTGSTQINGQQEMAIANKVYKMKLTNAESEEKRNIATQEKEFQHALDKINARTDFEGAVGAAKKAQLLKDEEELHLEKLRLIGEEASFTEKALMLARQKAVEKAGTVGTTAERISAVGEAGIFGKTVENEDGTTSVEKSTATAQQKIQKLRDAFAPMMEELKALGPEGALMSSIATGALNVASAIETIGDSGATTASKLEAVGSIVSSFGAIAAASSKARVAGIDQEIAAEKQRDGKSAGSIAKLKALEARKEAIKRKAFETDKKTKLAGAVINTAAAMIAAASPPNPPLPLSLPMVAMAGLMGAMQIAAISKMKYAGGGSSSAPSMPSTSLSIGSRSNAVDVSNKGTGSELSYLRGSKGGAGGYKGYAGGGEGIMVGERGPELITPNKAIDVTPNDKLGGSTNVNFSINAVDAAGVEDLLVNQRGNIIRMIREAANENGEDFLTQVDPMAYGSNS